VRAGMPSTNAMQKNYYEERFDAYQSGHSELPSATRFTNVWWGLRERICALEAQIGVYDDLAQLHRDWLGDLHHADVLDLGCFSGNELSLYLAQNASGSSLTFDARA
jgi:hypothetical protein